MRKGKQFYGVAISVLLLMFLILMSCGQTGPMTITSITPSNLVYTAGTGTVTTNLSISVSNVPTNDVISAVMSYQTTTMTMIGQQTFYNPTPFNALTVMISIPVNTNVLTKGTGTWTMQLFDFSTSPTKTSNIYPGTITVN